MKGKVLLILIILLFFTSWGNAEDWYRKIEVHIHPITFFFDGQKAEQEKEGYVFNGNSYVPSAMNYKGTTYVPIRYIGESLGEKVGWDQDTYSIWVGKKPQELQENQQDTSQTGTTKEIESANQAEGIYGITLGQTAKEVKAVLGEPQRIDKSALGYVWWVYNQDVTNYVQVGIQNGKVVDLYSNASTWSFHHIKVGTPPAELEKMFSGQDTVTFTYDDARFEIENNIKGKVLSLVNNKPVVFYQDQFNEDRVTAVRFISKEILVKSKMFSMHYQYENNNVPGIEAPVLSTSEQQQLNLSMERQVFDLTNGIRVRKGLSTLTWNEEAAQVAQSHSQDMRQNHFFSHESPTTGMGPFERMKKHGIDYRMAGENIAMGLFDAIEAHEAWMNSEGHRKNILEAGYTTLGVGVKGEYYTQDFVTNR